MTFANSFNVARRLTARNEPDLVQDTFVRDESSSSFEECQVLASRINSIQNLPLKCLRYSDILRSINDRRNITKSDNAIAFDGMGGSSAAAISARANGKEHYAQIQRRYTNSKRFQKDEN